jgi:hypothetical protein
VGYFCYFPKLTKVHSHSMGEYSPNLVTLLANLVETYTEACVTLRFCASVSFVGPVR